MRVFLAALVAVLGTAAAADSPPRVTCPNEATTPVYTEIRQTDSFVLIAVGTIPANVPCDVSQGVVVGGGVYYVVPRARVTFTGTVRPDVVVAICV